MAYIISVICKFWLKFPLGLIVTYYQENQTPPDVINLFSRAFSRVVFINLCAIIIKTKKTTNIKPGHSQRLLRSSVLITPGELRE